MEENNIDSSFPTYQGTWMKGEVNFTVRGHDKDSVVSDLGHMVTRWASSPAAIGTQSKQPTTQAAKTGVICIKCQSDMAFKTKEGKKGPYDIYECTNTNCNTNESNGRFYRTSIFANKVK